MRTNAVSIKLLHAPIPLGISDLDNRSVEKSDDTKNRSKNSMRSTESFNNKYGKTSIGNTKISVKYFPPASFKAIPTLLPNNMYKKSDMK
jgi:hypothetical protein